MKAFKESKEQALHYAKGALEDENGKLYTVMRGDTVLSSCTVDFSTDYNYFTVLRWLRIVAVKELALIL